jgi:hypothetical protein
MALLEMRLLEDAELSFTKHEAISTSRVSLCSRTALEIS